MSVGQVCPTNNNSSHLMNDNRAASVQRLAAIASERVQALLATSIQTTTVRL